jgi:hypothetical protein
MAFLKPSEQQLIQSSIGNRENQAEITLVTTGHKEDASFQALSEELLSLKPHPEIKFIKKESGLPGFQLKDNLLFSAFPLERELEPFLDALAQLTNPAPEAVKLSSDIRENLSQIHMPVRLTLYIALQCPFCPVMVKTLIPLALNCSHMLLHIIDGSLFPESASKDKVMSAPCLILEDEFRWTGQVSAQEILGMILSRDPSQLSPETLKTILEQGDADWLIQAMIKKNQIFDGVIKLLLHENWSVRLGAMVVVEELAETAPKLAGLFCPVLMDRFDGAEVTVKGDILYALGLAGNVETLAWIRSKRPDMEHHDLIDAAEDAMENLENNL